jgi:hypothetical protein
MAFRVNRIGCRRLHRSSDNYQSKDTSCAILSAVVQYFFGRLRHGLMATTMRSGRRLALSEPRSLSEQFVHRCRLLPGVGPCLLTTESRDASIWSRDFASALQFWPISPSRINVPRSCSSQADPLALCWPISFLERNLRVIVEEENGGEADAL